MSTPEKQPNWATPAGLPAAVTLLLVLMYLYRVLHEGGGISQDFGVYYAAAAAVAHGANPYDMEILQAYLSSNALPFVYPLVTAYLFRPFLLFPFEAAGIVYALLKSACLFYLVRLWGGHFLPVAKSFQEFILQAVILAFGLSLTIYCDLTGGNVSIIEQTLLWTGFVFFLRGRLWLFCACVVLAASFKFTLSLALLLLFTTDYRWRSAALYLSLAALAIVPGVSYLLAPGYLGEYLGLLTLQGATQRGFTNPSLLSALVDFPYLSSIPYASLAAYAAAVIFVLVMTTKTIRRGASRTEIVLLFTVAYALAMPRMSPYSYIILLPAISYLFMAWQIELPKWALPAAAVGLPVILSAHSIGGTFVHPWIDWIGKFHHVALSATCFGWWLEKQKAAYPVKMLPLNAAMESSAASIGASASESTAM